jgi:hypothetical protein
MFGDAAIRVTFVFNIAQRCVTTPRILLPLPLLCSVAVSPQALALHG